MKYKLIKEYPGSPELGTVHSSENKTNEWKGIGFYVSHPEYWKKVTDKHYVVFKDKYQSFDPWKVYQVHNKGCLPILQDSLRNFKTEEEAEEFILYNKPCLSYDDVCKMFGYSREFNGDVIAFYISEKSLKEFVKLKL